MIRPTHAFVSLLTLLALGAPSAMAAPLSVPTHAISPDAPWARAIDDELSKPVVEQLYGREVAEAWRDIEPHWQGNQLYTRDSFDEDMLVTLGVDPLPAMNYDPSPGVVYVAMDGVTLKPTCGNGDSANSALNCSPLVSAETTFAAFGNGAAEFQQLAAYYEDFDLVFTSNRPPDWLPYTMAVVGGSAAQIGVAGACGIANVACDGLKRNHVSLNFPQSCNGMAETAAQETSHNWGLEHTDNPTDLLYPFNNGGFKTFVDECMPISNATGDGITSCGYIHEIYCETGMGEEQNSHAELMGVFGPKNPDTEAPQIVSIQPENGAVLGNDEAILVTASIDDNSTFIGVNWTWLEGLPPGFESYRRCTNNVCDDDFNPGPSFNAIDMPWDFVALTAGAPAGTYSFQIEALDAYGNYASEIVTFEIVEGPGDTSGGSGSGGGVDESGGATSGEPPAGTGGTDDTAGGDATGTGASDGGNTGGCRIAQGDLGPLGAGMLGLLVLGLRRRRQ